MSVPRVTVLAFDGISPFHLSVPSLVWGARSPAGDSEPWDITVAAQRPGRLHTGAGYSIDVPAGLDTLRDAAIVVVPWWSDPTGPVSTQVSEALRDAHERGALIVGLCLGVFVVADSGLLDDRPATTHWGWTDEFRRRFPAVALRPDALYVDDGDIVTGAGATAGIDTCLHLLARFAGTATSNRVARRIVAAPHRPGGQAQFIETPVPAQAGGGDPLGDAMAWAQRNIADDIGIDELARRAAMSRSTFTRSFRARTGTSVHRWLIGRRVDRARYLLETTTMSVEQVAAQSGFGTATRLREHFARTLATTPSRYRAEFGPSPSELLA